MAASSIVVGISSMNDFISNNANGRLMSVWAKIRHKCVSCSPVLRKIKTKGMIIAIGGSIL